MPGSTIAVVGGREQCLAESARKAGDEAGFQVRALENIATLSEAGARTIVTHCPHCLQVLGQDYPRLGGDFTVLHHTQLLETLIDEGRIPAPAGVADGGLTYHDPCTLSRVGGEYEAPRAVARFIAGERVAEMPRQRDRTFCCGGGRRQLLVEGPRAPADQPPPPAGGEGHEAGTRRDGLPVLPGDARGRNPSGGGTTRSRSRRTGRGWAAEAGLNITPAAQTRRRDMTTALTFQAFVPDQAERLTAYIRRLVPHKQPELQEVSAETAMAIDAQCVGNFDLRAQVNDFLRSPRARTRSRRTESRSSELSGAEQDELLKSYEGTPLFQQLLHLTRVDFYNRHIVWNTLGYPGLDRRLDGEGYLTRGFDQLDW